MTIACQVLPEGLELFKSGTLLAVVSKVPVLA